MNKKEIDFSKFELKCKGNDCEENTENLCCMACDKYNECLQKNWVCICLDNDGLVENCPDFYLERIKD